jgi:hypothetical protein
MTTHATLPQGLYRSRPREVRLSASGRFLAAMAIALCVASPLVVVALRQQALADIHEREALLTTGVVADALVTRLKRESKDSNRASVYYTFDVNGRTIEDRAKIPMARWRQLTIGDRMPVRYLDSKPSVNIPDGVVPKVMPVAVAYVVGPLMLVAAAGCWFGLSFQRRLLSEGRAALATVTSVKHHKGQHGSYNTVRYDFALVSGAIQHGSTNVTSKAPAVGDSIAVVYDDERPGRSRLYPLSLVRLAED